MHWPLWSHGSYLIDADDKVIINSPETVKALEYVKQLYETFIPGTASWNNSSNNKAFLAGELTCTSNGISIYVTAKTSAPQIAEDMNHGLFPVGPIGKPQELQLCFPQLIFNFTNTRRPAGADDVHDGSRPSTIPGWRPPPDLTQPRTPTSSTRSGRGPENTVFRDAAERSLRASGIGPVNEKAADRHLRLHPGRHGRGTSTRAARR